MRQLAVELGCSPMTPYRYFRDKEEILAAVRAASFHRLADRLDRAAAKVGSSDPAVVSRRMAEAYGAFVEDEPQAFRLMFDLGQPSEEAYPALQEASARARRALTDPIRRCGSGRRAEEALDEVAQSVWAAVHGVLMLHLSGKLPPGRAPRAFAEQVVARLGAAVAVEESLLVGGF